jgi:hypothetical protein
MKGKRLIRRILAAKEGVVRPTPLGPRDAPRWSTRTNPAFGAASHRRISELIDSVQLTKTSRLTGFRPVPRVRIPLPPPRSLSCRETWSNLTDNRWKWPQFRDSSREIGPEKVHSRTTRPRFSTFFSGAQTSSPVSTTPRSEWNAITNRWFGESASLKSKKSPRDTLRWPCVPRICTLQEPG